MSITQNLLFLKLNYPLIVNAITTRTSHKVSKNETSTPKIPINLYALDCQREIDQTISYWCNQFAIKAMGIYAQLAGLEAQNQALQTQSGYLNYEQDLQRLVRKVIKLLTQPREKIDLGECFKCQHRILGLENQDGKCRNCGQPYSYRGQVNRQITQIQNLLLTAKELLAVENRLKTSFPDREKLYLSKLYRWAKEQKIVNYAPSGQPALYKWGEVNRMLSPSRDSLTTRKNENKILISLQ